MAVNINWDDLTFSHTPTDYMFRTETNEDGTWREGEMVPYGDISISPCAGVLNYGQGLFEGMKAQRAADGSIVLFRPIENGKRLLNGAQRLVLHEYPPEKFVEAVKEVVLANKDYIPPTGKGALYIRPILFGSGAILGVAPAPVSTFMIYVTPVGPYFKGGMKPIRLVISTKYDRAAPHGIGAIKAIGNYSATLLPGKIAKQAGYAENVYLNAGNNKTIEEVGAANFFCINKGDLHTPYLSGSILPGITRDSILKLAHDKLGLNIYEREIPYSEIPNAEELFCSGTAAVISPIGSVTIEGTEHVCNDFEVGKITKTLYDLLTGIQTRQEPDPYDWVVTIE
ncbi:MAG: branched-chain amino acid aminotransferase [Planctomycetota bacterium]|jgi:branched-chain amino acid aminotransferase